MTRPPLDLRAFGIHDASGIATRWDQQRGEWWDAPPDNARGGGDDGLTWLGPIWHDWGIRDQLVHAAGATLDLHEPSGRPHRPPAGLTGTSLAGKLDQYLDATPVDWPPRDPFDGFDGPRGQPNCTHIELPPFDEATATFNPSDDPGRDKRVYPIRWCIGNAYGITDWPPTDCRAPCLQRQVCTVPTQAQVDQVVALPEMVIRKVTDDELRRRNDLTHGDIRPLIATAEADWVEFVRAAVAMLRANSDLVEWSLCVASAYNPRMTPADTRRIWAWLEERLDRGFNVYLVGCLGGGSPGIDCDDLAYDGENATGSATESWQKPVNCLHDPVSCFTSIPNAQVACRSEVPPEGDGVVVSGDVEGRRELLGDWLRAASVEAAFHPTLVLANGLLHELLHLASVYPVSHQCPPGFSPDSNEDDVAGSHCWRLQAQTTNNLAYAMYSRYHCGGSHRLDGAIRRFMFAAG
ncbi:MAG: hypothetical protein H6735_01335 [Alphaproteobacteria bacterium]|nr:hypothetical protein [Alphaproteobacteria bacterium]